MNATMNKPRKMTPATRRKLAADLAVRLTWQDIARLDLPRGTYIVAKTVGGGHEVYREYRHASQLIGVASDFDGVLDLIQAD